MGKISQTGHDQNCAKFGKVYFFVKSKTDFTPPDISLTEPKVLNKWNEMKQAIDEHNNEAAKWGGLVNIRGDAMKLVNPFMTQVKNTVLACPVSESFKKDVTAKVKKIQGVRATPKIKVVPGTEVPTDESIKQISAAQTGIDDKLAFIAELILMLKNEPLYTPAIDAHKVAELTTWLAGLNGKNDAVNEQFAVTDNKRLGRNKSLYDAHTGGNETASKIKKAFKSQYGGNSPEYHQISKIKFTTPKL
jgi:hypothetical protein